MRFCRLIVASGILATSLGCGEREVAIGGIEDIKSASVESKPETKSPSSKLDPPDHSLNLSEYISAGVPAIDHPWSGIELTEALNILKSISQSDSSRLPRFKSDRSGDLFSRIVSDENLNPFRDESRPSKDRLSDSVPYIDASNQMTKMYLESARTQATGGAEVVELIGSNLRLSVAISKAIDDYLPTLDKGDSGYDYRVNNLKAIQYGLGVMIAGSIQLLSEAQTYKAPELKQLIEYQLATIPLVFADLPKESQTEIMTRLDKYASDGQMSYLNPGLSNLAAKVNEAAGKLKK